MDWCAMPQCFVDVALEVLAAEQLLQLLLELGI